MSISNISQVHSAGIGLRVPHVQEVLQRESEIPWLELLLDNWLYDGGATEYLLSAVLERFPVAMHGVGLSIASSCDFDMGYLKKVKALLNKSNALVYSEHLSFSQAGQHFIADLLPFPFTDAYLDYLSERVDFVQNYLGRQIILENISAYVVYKEDHFSEAEFITELVRRTGCGLLLDINNLYVNQINLGRNAEEALQYFPLQAVQQVHLAGFEQKEGYVIDAHNNPVATEAWKLYKKLVDLIGPVATLIEWDNDLPELDVLLGEQKKAQHILNHCLESVA